MKNTFTQSWRFLVAASLLAGCGMPSEDNGQLTDTRGEVINISIAEAAPSNPGFHALLLSTPRNYTKVIVCQQSAASCTENTAGVLISTLAGSSTDRNFFKTNGYASIAATSKLVAQASTAEGAVVRRVFGFAARSALSDTSVSPTAGVNWKVVLMASDQGNQGAWISAFDNARLKLKELFTRAAVPAQNIRELSLKPKYQTNGVAATTLPNFEASLAALQPSGPSDACIVHMTSHGAKQGFCLGSKLLAPAELNAALDRTCGSKPTVVLISACYSGLYVLDSSGVKKPNRIILTAASHDRTSFGCSPENQYTYWDNCLIDSLPTSATWKDLSVKIRECIVRKEGGTTASNPQAFIGSQVEGLAVPRMTP